MSDLLARLLRLPGAPEAPPGDEGSVLCFRAAPNYLHYLQFKWLMGVLTSLFGLVILILFLVGSLPQDESYATLITSIGTGLFVLFLLQWVVRLALVRLDYHNRWYLVTDRSLRVREGIREVKETTFTFANIQNLTVTQGPIQRMLKIADLRVETAGGRSIDGRVTVNLGSHIAFFRGIDKVEEIRKLINDRMAHFRDSGLGDPDDVASQQRASLPSVSSSYTNPLIGRDEIQALRGVLTEARALRKSLEDRGTHRPVA